MTSRPSSPGTSPTASGDVPRAEQIVEEEIQRFAVWLGQLDVRPTVAELRRHGNAIVDQVLAENDGLWESASTRDLARVQAATRAVMSRLLHEPTVRLKALDPDRSHGGVKLVRELFALGGTTPRPPAAASGGGGHGHPPIAGSENGAPEAAAAQREKNVLALTRNRA